MGRWVKFIGVIINGFVYLIRFGFNLPSKLKMLFRRIDSF